MKKTKKPKYRLWEYCFWLLSYVGLILPLVILVITKREIYFKPKNAWGTSLSLVIVLVVILLKNRTKNFGGLFWLAIATLLSYLLSGIIVDLKLILSLCFVGALIYAILNKIRLWFKLRADALMNGSLNALAQQDNVNTIANSIKNIGRI